MSCDIRHQSNNNAHRHLLAESQPPYQSFQSSSVVHAEEKEAAMVFPALQHLVHHVATPYTSALVPFDHVHEVTAGKEDDGQIVITYTPDPLLTASPSEPKQGADVAVEANGGLRSMRKPVPPPTPPPTCPRRPASMDTPSTVARVAHEEKSSDLPASSRAGSINESPSGHSKVSVRLFDPQHVSPENIEKPKTGVNDLGSSQADSSIRRVSNSAELTTEASEGIEIVVEKKSTTADNVAVVNHRTKNPTSSSVPKTSNSSTNIGGASFRSRLFTSTTSTGTAKATDHETSITPPANATNTASFVRTRPHSADAAVGLGKADKFSSDRNVNGVGDGERNTDTNGYNKKVRPRPLTAGDASPPQQTHTTALSAPVSKEVDPARAHESCTSTPKSTAFSSSSSSFITSSSSSSSSSSTSSSSSSWTSSSTLTPTSSSLTSSSSSSSSLVDDEETEGEKTVNYLGFEATKDIDEDGAVTMSSFLRAMEAAPDWLTLDAFAIHVPSARSDKFPDLTEAPPIPAHQLAALASASRQNSESSRKMALASEGLQQGKAHDSIISNNRGNTNTVSSGINISLAIALPPSYEAAGIGELVLGKEAPNPPRSTRDESPGDSASPLITYAEGLTLGADGKSIIPISNNGGVDSDTSSSIGGLSSAASHTGSNNSSTLGTGVGVEVRPTLSGDSAGDQPADEEFSEDPIAFWEVRNVVRGGVGTGADSRRGPGGSSGSGPRPLLSTNSSSSGGGRGFGSLTAPFQLNNFMTGAHQAVDEVDSADMSEDGDGPQDSSSSPSSMMSRDNRRRSVAAMGVGPLGSTQGSAVSGGGINAARGGGVDSLPDLRSLGTFGATHSYLTSSGGRVTVMYTYNRPDGAPARCPSVGGAVVGSGAFVEAFTYGELTVEAYSSTLSHPRSALGPGALIAGQSGIGGGFGFVSNMRSNSSLMGGGRGGSSPSMFGGYHRASDTATVGQRLRACHLFYSIGHQRAVTSVAIASADEALILSCAGEGVTLLRQLPSTLSTRPFASTPRPPLASAYRDAPETPLHAYNNGLEVARLVLSNPLDLMERSVVTSGPLYHATSTRIMCGSLMTVKGAETFLMDGVLRPAVYSSAQPPVRMGVATAGTLGYVAHPQTGRGAPLPIGAGSLHPAHSLLSSRAGAGPNNSSSLSSNLLLTLPKPISYAWPSSSPSMVGVGAGITPSGLAMGPNAPVSVVSSSPFYSSPSVYSAHSLSTGPSILPTPQPSLVLDPHASHFNPPEDLRRGCLGAAGSQDALLGFTNQEGLVLHMTISTDFKLAATGSSDGLLTFFELATMRRVAVCQHQKPIRCSAFSKNGKYAISGCVDGSCRLWSTKRNTQANPVSTYFGHKACVTTVAFQSTQGDLAVSGSEDGQVHVWNAATGATVKVVAQHRSAVLTACFLHYEVPPAARLMGIARMTSLGGGGGSSSEGVLGTSATAFAARSANGGTNSRAGSNVGHETSTPSASYLNGLPGGGLPGNSIPKEVNFILSSCGSFVALAEVKPSYKVGGSVDTAITIRFDVADLLARDRLANARFPARLQTIRTHRDNHLPTITCVVPAPQSLMPMCLFICRSDCSIALYQLEVDVTFFENGGAANAIFENNERKNSNAQNAHHAHNSAGLVPVRLSNELWSERTKAPVVCGSTGPSCTIVLGDTAGNVVRLAVDLAVPKVLWSRDRDGPAAAGDRAMSAASLLEGVDSPLALLNSPAAAVAPNPSASTSNGRGSTMLSPLTSTLSPPPVQVASAAGYAVGGTPLEQIQASSMVRSSPLTNASNSSSTLSALSRMGTSPRGGSASTSPPISPPAARNNGGVGVVGGGGGDPNSHIFPPEATSYHQRPSTVATAADATLHTNTVVSVASGSQIPNTSSSSVMSPSSLAVNAVSTSNNSGGIAQSRHRHSSRSASSNAGIGVGAAALGLLPHENGPSTGGSLNVFASAPSSLLADKGRDHRSSTPSTSASGGSTTVIPSLKSHIRASASHQHRSRHSGRGPSSPLPASTGGSGAVGLSTGYSSPTPNQRPQPSPANTAGVASGSSSRAQPTPLVAPSSSTTIKSPFYQTPSQRSSSRTANRGL